MDDAPLLPLFLKLHARRVVVVGGGPIGARKALDLAAAGANVTVVAIDAIQELHAAAHEQRITLRLAPFEERDLEGAWLAIAATGVREVDGAVFAAGEGRRIFVNAVDDPPRSSAYFASVIRRPPFTVAISSAGELPAMARLLREIIEGVLPEARWIEAARALRRRWKAERTPMKDRFAELVATIVRPPQK